MKKYIIPAIVVVLGVSLYILGRFYVGKQMDYWERPWAYTKDQNAPLLVGKWQGSFIDPNGVSKQIRLEVFVPETDSARWDKAFDLNRKRDHDLKRNLRFEGAGKVISKLGTEYYDLSGMITDKAGHRFALYFHTNEKRKKVLPNFALSSTDDNSKWEGNEMDLPTSFTFYKADNVLSYNTGDPRHMKKVTIHMNRILDKQ